jgi:hypothetical protein
MAILALKLSRLLVNSTNENATKLQRRRSPSWRPNKSFAVDSEYVIARGLREREDEEM